MRLVDVACGASHTAAAGGGFVFTWGDDEWRQLGRRPGEDEALRRVPRRVRELVDPEEPVDRVACGEKHTAALCTRTGAVWAWGCGASLGRRGGDDVAVPARARNDAWERGGELPASVCCGDRFTVVVTQPAGRAYSWGAHADGRLGGADHDLESPALVSQEAFAGHEVAQCVASAHSSACCALVHGFSGTSERFSSISGTVAARAR